MGLVAVGFGPATPARAAAACTNGYLSIVAHHDDDLYFQSPDLLNIFDKGECLRTVYLSAGDSGYTETYWAKREAGIEASYASMAGVANAWTTDKVTAGGQQVRVRTLNARPNVSVVHMRLPDGMGEGTGSELYDFESLSRVLDGDIPTIHAVDGSASYTSTTLRNALLDLINAAQPDHLNTLDYVHASGTDSDNYDHHATGLLAQDASKYASRGHTLTGYEGYPTEDKAQNVTGTPLARKTAAYDTYQYVALPFEPLYHPAFMYRQYTVDTTTVAGPVANAGTDQQVTLGKTVTLDGSQSRLGVSAITYQWRQTSGPVVQLTGANTAKPTFTPTVAGTHTFEMTISDGKVTAKDSVSVTVSGSETNLALGAAATASSQNTADSQTAAKAIDGVVDGYPGDYTKEWATVGGKAGSWLNLKWASPVTLNQVVLHDRPNTGDQVTAGTLLFSDGSTVAVPSLDNAGGPITVTFPDKTNVTSLRFTATGVSAGTGNVGLAEIVATRTGATANKAPVANAGADQTIGLDSQVTLDASASSDPDAGTTLTYEWKQLDGPAVTLSDPKVARPTFTPKELGAYTFQLTVSDGSVQVTDTVVLTTTKTNLATSATATASSQNTATAQTAAKAIDGVAQGYPGDATKEWATVAGKAGSWLNLAWPSPVTLDEVVLHDRPNLGDQVTAGTLTFSDGTSVAVPSLDNAGGPTTVRFAAKTVTSMRFTATSVAGTTGNIGLAEITAQRVGATASQPVNRAPVANAGPDQTTSPGTRITLDASASTDPDAGTTLTYQWVQTDGPSVSLADTSAVRPAFTPAAEGTYAFRVTVSDGSMTATDTVAVAVSKPNVARTATATASSQNTAAGQTAAKAVDGVVAGYPEDATKEWATVAGKAGSWLNLAWASPVTIDEVILYDRPNLGDQITGGKLTFSDGSTVNVPSLNNEGRPVYVDVNGNIKAGPTRVTFPAKTVSSVRFTVSTVSGTTGNVGLAEMLALRAAPAANRAPVANAGADQAIDQGKQATLNGSASSDPDSGTNLSYKWETVSAPGAVTLSSTTASRPTFTPAQVGTYTFKLTVSDGSLSASDTVTFTATAPNVARTATATASSQNTATAQTAAKAIDGVVDGYPGDSTKEWATVGGKAGSWLNLAWASPVTINQVVLYDRPNTGDRVTAGTLTFSDGSTVAVPSLDNAGGAITVNFPNKTVTSMRFTATTVASTTGNVGLAEIRALKTG